MTTCDILLIGVGGQGVVTLGDLIARVAVAADVPILLVPTKGMAQRGGFVKVEIRLGHHAAGPRIRRLGADIVASMERSEALRGIPFVRPDGDFILLDNIWEPTGVMLGESEYPSFGAVRDAISVTGARLLVLDPAARPEYDGRPVSDNIVLLGAMFASNALSSLIRPLVVEQIIAARWPKAKDSNLLAFRSGLAAGSPT